MNSLPEDELSPALKEALAGLPRERDPGRLLEERTVRALRERGLLRPTARRRILFPAAWIASAAAACLAVFAGGVAVGQRMALREAMLEVRAANAGQATLRVQETGAAYVSALARLQQVADTASTEQRQQAREVAVQALRAAADELVRFAPDDPVASGILAGFDRAADAQRPQRDAALRRPDVVWF